MDAGQAWRSLRSETEHGTTQAARVLAACHLPEEPAQVRAHWHRGDEDCEAAPHQGGREGPHRPHLPRWVHGSVIIMIHLVNFKHIMLEQKILKIFNIL